MPHGKMTGATLRDREGRRLWIQTEAGEFLPVRSQADIAKRGRGPGLPDWWVVAKDPDWLPSRAQGPARSLLAAGRDRDAADDAGGDADADTGFPGEGTKIGAGNKAQPYGWHGWYGTTLGTGAAGKGKGREKKAPPSPKVFTYRQGSGEFRGPDGSVLDKGHSGRGEFRDKPDLEHVKDNGPIPRREYRVTKVIEDPSDPKHVTMGRHILRLEPADEQTRQKLKEMNRDGFWIHGGTTPNASHGCILIPEDTRRQIPVGSVVRVVR